MKKNSNTAAQRSNTQNSKPTTQNSKPTTQNSNPTTQNSNPTTQNSTTHIQLGGQAFYDERNFFMFAPDDPQPERVSRFRGRGTAQQMSDGTFDFIPDPPRKRNADRIATLPHGCVTKTNDGAILLSLKVFLREKVCVSRTISRESRQAVAAIKEYESNKQ